MGSSKRWRPAQPTPLVELVDEDQALGVLQRGVFALVSQEVAQLSGGEHAAVAGVVPKYGVQLGPPQQLPAELLDLYVVQATVSGSVAPLGGNNNKKKDHINHIQLWFSEEPGLESGSRRSGRFIWVETEVQQAEISHNNQTTIGCGRRHSWLKRWFLQLWPAEPDLEQGAGVLLAQVDVDHLEEPLHLLVAHLPVLVLVGSPQVASDPGLKES